MAHEPAFPSVNPLSLSVTELARLLSAAGSRKVTPEAVDRDIAAGAPVEKDGRISLVAYTAWLLREVQSK